MYLVDHKAILCDSFGMAVKTTSLQGLRFLSLPSTQANQEKQVKPQESCPAESAYHLHNHTVRSWLFAIFRTCQCIQEIVEFHHKRLPTCFDFTLGQLLKANQSFLLGNFIIFIVTIGFATMLIRRCSPVVFIR